MRHHRFLIAISIVVAMSASAQEQPSTASEPDIKNQMKDLREALSAAHTHLDALELPLDSKAKDHLKLVREDLNALDKRLDAFDVPVSSQMWRLQSLANASRNTPGPYAESFIPANSDHLRTIQLPDDATKEQIRRYVDQVLSQSAGRNSYGSVDPEVRKLVEVGSDNVGILIDAINGTRGSARSYINWALQTLVKEEHKSLILDRLEKQPELIDVVRQNRWTGDAKPALLAALRNSARSIHTMNMPIQVVQTVAQYRDPDTYPILREYFINSSNRDHTYDALKRLPDFDLDDAVNDVWKSLNFNGLSGYESRAFAAIAALHGNLDALEIALESFANGNHRQLSPGPNPMVVARQMTGQTGTPDELLQWIENNRSRLRFDPELKQFVISDDVIAESTTDVAETREPSHPGTAQQSATIPQWPPHLRRRATSYRQGFRDISIPENPTKDEVQEYVRQISDRARSNYQFSSRDPEVKKIAEVGHDHLESLLEIAPTGSSYLTWAIESLVTIEDKDLVLKYLQQRHSLATIITKYHWEEDARQILLGELEKKPWSVSVQWISACIKLADNESYPSLLSALFANSTSMRWLSDDLSRLPDFDPRRIALDAWETADLQNSATEDLLPLAVMAAAFGQTDAMEFAVQNINWPQPQPDRLRSYRYGQFRRALLYYLDVPDEYENPVAWIEANQSNIEYDFANNKYIVQD